MKTKHSQCKQNLALDSIVESSLEDTGSSVLENEKIKNQPIKTDTTIAYQSQNQTSNKSIHRKSVIEVQNDKDGKESNLRTGKTRKSIKNKIIQKTIILRSDNKRTKSRRISKRTRLLKKKNKLRRVQNQKAPKKKIKILKKKQTIQEIKSQCPINNEKTVKSSKKLQKAERLNLDSCADIRMIGFDRKQLQKKRDDLLKRLVDDWNFIQRSRSDQRQLRNLNI